MRRARRSRPQLSLSLFPFLAVLICTMGVLIVLLVIVVKHADLHADEVKQEQTAELQQQQTEVEISKEHSEVRIALLTDVRAQVNKDLRDRQQIRSNIQSHISQLREQAEQIKARYQRLTSLNSEADAQRAAGASAQISALENQIAEASKQLEDISQQARQTKKSFAIVPYQGAGGTARQPIFVECTANAIILQPYGIELTPEDFAMPLIPGNPLDAALLTIRDYLHGHSVDSQREQAYPLLIVRPDGAVGYAMARRAMKSWVDQFGYELIPAGMPLTYPPADENLRQDIEKSIKAARIRKNAIKQAATRSVSLAQIANNQYGSRYAEGVRGDYRQGTLPSARGSRVANRSPQFMSPDGNARQGAEFLGDRVSSGGILHGGGGLREQQGDSRQGGVGQQRAGPEAEGIGRGNSGEGSKEFAGTGANGSPQGDALLSEGTSPNGTSANDTQFGDGQRPTSPSSESASGFAAASDSAFGQAGSNGATATGSQQAGKAGSGQTSKSGPQIGNAANNQAAFGQPSQGSGNQNSLAAKRGKDWALPDKTPNATVYRRQIFMQCSDQVLRFRNVNRVQAGGEAIVFDKQTIEHVDELIDLVWRRVENWGVAGVRSYWKPQLTIEIQKGGETRATEIQKLLENSGLDVLLIGP